MLMIDLPMPEACDVCPFNYDFCWCSAIKYEDWKKYEKDWGDNVCDREDRPEYCPLKELVRCKDCKWRSYYCTESTDGTTMYTCHYPCANDVPRPADWFCADGERRDET